MQLPEFYPQAFSFPNREAGSSPAGAQADRELLIIAGSAGLHVHTQCLPSNSECMRALTFLRSMLMMTEVMF